ncbi:hypothetical protein WH52_09775 [Tenacibaculum holothuriorum]|uniref:Secretion system C-terminal sorting domain-containing protein n=1 Tax=Tenacibaculum holothuriorum TaxID=1635173 RepID=A0A1Y2PD92_9FLAO|nr:FG-GAP-like repeat-containing protein [Tenacibaculum holothuriorum]OSY87709.1 hypothetical protein WH52_09775 [Tenacibaculum holothuriorum]
MQFSYIKKELLFFIFFIPVYIFSQTLFESKNIYKKQKEQKIVLYSKAVDIDGDGDKDIISSSSYNGQKLVWHENLNGKGNFGLPIYIEDTHGAIAIEKILVADFDGDNDLDILSVSRSYIILHINSNGNYDTSKKIYGVSYSYLITPSLVEVYDLDGDGDKDIIHSTSMFKNIGQNNFETTGIGSASLLTNQKIRKLLPINIDNDEDIELLVISVGDDNVYKVSILDKINSSAFYNEIKTLVTASEEITSITVADIYPDSYLDICYTVNRTNSNHFWIKNIDNTLTFEDSKELSIHDGQMRDVFFLDMNGDNAPDLVGNRGVGYGIMWMKNDGEGNFIDNNAGDNSVFLDRIVTEDIEVVDTSDINNDGKLDFILSSSKDDEGLFGWYKGLGDEKFSNMNIISKKGNIASEFIVVDIDNDGDMDTFNGPVGDYIYLHENINGKLARHQIEVGDFDRSSYYRIGDLNNDNNPDLVCKTKNGIVWLKKEQNKLLFNDKKTITSDYYRNDLVLADINNDNQLDVITIQNWYKNINKGEGFEKQSTFKSLDGLDVFKIVVSDIDLDKDLDIIIGSSNGKTYGSSSKNLIGFYENTDGKGTFSDLQVILELSQSESIGSFTVGDIDNDEDEDIAIGFKPNHIKVLENKDGDFSTVVDDKEYPNLYGIFFIDIDNDNKKDLLVDSNNRLEKSLWYKNKGDKTFESGETMILSNNAWHNGIATIADINNDGATDILFRYFSSITYLQYTWGINSEGTLSIDDNVSESLLNNRVKVFPNPVEDFLSIESKLNIKSIEIFNSLGQKKKEVNNKKIISFRGLNQGIYFVKLKSEDGSEITKTIIKQ